MPSTITDILNRPYSAGIILNKFKENRYDVIGDSRAADTTVATATQVGLQGTNWLNWANVLTGNRFVLNNVFATAGARSDEYIRTYWGQVMTSSSKYLIWNYPIVNDLAQSVAGYVTADGVTVTSANAARLIASRIQARVTEATDAGKIVIFTLEPGATNLDAATVMQLHDFNLRMRTFGRTQSGVIVWSANSALWNPTASATVIGFRTGMLKTGDTTHYGVLGGYTAGSHFATNVIPYLNLPWSDTQIASINDTFGQNPRQMIRNALFNTTSGGTRTTIGGSGNVPSGWRIVGAAGTTADITSAANASGFGNDITLTITSTGSDTVTFDSTSVATTDFTVDDQFDFEAEVDVAIGSSKAGVHSNLQVSTNLGTSSWWCMYGGAAGLEPYPEVAYSMKLKSQKATALAGSTSTVFLSPRINVFFTSAGNATVTIRRVSCTKRLLT